MSNIDTGHVDIVERAAKEGGERAMEWFRTELDSENKVESSAEIVNLTEVVTDIDGEKWTHESQELVASNGRSNDEVLAVARTMAGNR